MAERATRASFVIVSAAGMSLLGVGVARAGAAGMPPSGRVFGLCTRALVPEPTLRWAATVGLAAVVAVSIARAGLALARLLHAALRVRRLGAVPRMLRGRTVSVLPSGQAVAFCAGVWRPRIHLSAGTVRLLDAGQLDAVLAHEHHHAHRRDPLRLAAREVIARALFFLPGLPALAARLTELSEQAADAHAVRRAGGDPRPLAGALLKFDAMAATAGAGISPGRVDRLTGVAPQWSPPWRRLGIAAAVLAGLGVTVAAGAPVSAAAAAALHLCLVTIAMLGTLGSPVVAAAVARRSRV